MTKEQRRKAIIKRRIFVTGVLAVLLLIIFLIAFAVKAVLDIGGDKGEKPQSSIPETSESEIIKDNSSTISSEEPSAPEYPDTGINGLDANFSKLLLVNDKNPLPKDYDYEGNLTTIPQKYIKGSLTKIDKDVWIYLKAMLDAANSEGIDMGVWSPYRSYETQRMLFNNKINRVKASKPALTDAEAEAEAATVVARPGTSEHHTGLALDINCANSSFEKTEAFKWLQENAADYGFIMRYSAEKQKITGVIHESWHYRFVGINTAKEINRLGMCLEEYVEHIK